jgi:hypothetical protein
MFFPRGLIHTLPAEVLISRPAGREAFMAAQAYVFPMRRHLRRWKK